MRTVAAEDFRGRTNAGGVHHAMQSAERRHSKIDGGLDLLLAGNVGLRELRPGAKRLLSCLAGLGIDVDDHDVAARGENRFGARAAQARCATSHNECLS
jgi:hypothetical protein